MFICFTFIDSCDSVVVTFSQIILVVLVIGGWIHAHRLVVNLITVKHAICLGMSIVLCDRRQLAPTSTTEGMHALSLPLIITREY